MNEQEGQSRRDPEEIRQEIEATKDRISDSVEALAEVKADIDFVKSHPKEALMEKVVAAKDDIVQRVQEKKEEFSANHAATSFTHTEGVVGGTGATHSPLARVKEKVASAYGAIETKLDGALGVDETVDRQAF